MAIMKCYQGILAYQFLKVDDKQNTYSEVLQALRPRCLGTGWNGLPIVPV